MVALSETAVHSNGFNIIPTPCLNKMTDETLPPARVYTFAVSPETKTSPPNVA